MPVQQFMIYLLYEAKPDPDDKIQKPQTKFISADLVRDNLADFLASVPDDINGNSQIWVSIERPDGEIVSYADDMQQVKPRSKNFVKIRGRSKEAVRSQANIFASRRRDRRKAQEAD